MVIFYKLMGLMACGFGWLCGLGMKGFFSLLSISPGGRWFRIFAVALFPIALPLLVMGLLFFPISAVFGLVEGYGLSVHGVLEEAGISLGNRAQRARRLLRWTDIREFRRVYFPPGHSYRAVLKSGEIVVIGQIETGPLATALEKHGIPFVGKDKDLFEREFGSVKADPGSTHS